MKIRLALFSLLICAGACFGHRNTPAASVPFWHTTAKDSLLAEQILSDLRPHADESAAALMLRAGEALDGQPYVGGTLEESETEQLSIYLTRTDCILYVETCLALARTARAGGDFVVFADELRQSRYRNGQVHAYADRLHYTLDWARQGVRRGTLQDMTRTLGGVAFDHPINYMSTHAEAYPRMNDIAAIRAAEVQINAEPFWYIPKSRIGQALPEIRNGDIICLVSSISGLDIAHVGMAVVDPDGKVRFRHASSAANKVILDPKPLSDYLASRRNITGIQIYRPL